MKIKMLLAMGLGTLCGLAGNVCTWSGAAGTGRLGDAGNWDTLPVSGNGDTLNFDAASGTLTNDFSVLEVARMTFLGTEEVKLTGGKIVFNAPGTEVWNNFAKVVLDVPFQVSGEGDSKFYVYGSIDFLKPVTIDDKAAMMGWGPVQDGTRSPTLRVHFYETVTGGGTESKLYLGYGRGSHTYFHKTVGVAALKNSNLYNRDYVHFMAPENNVTYYQP